MKTIAIIEDDQPIGDLLEEALGQAGYATLLGLFRHRGSIPLGAGEARPDSVGSDAPPA